MDDKAQSSQHSKGRLDAINNVNLWRGITTRLGCWLRVLQNDIVIFGREGSRGVCLF